MALPEGGQVKWGLSSSLLDDGQHGSWVHSPDSYLQTAHREQGVDVHEQYVHKEDHRLFIPKSDY